MSPATKGKAGHAAAGAVSAGIGTFGVGLLSEWGIIPPHTGPFSLALYNWMAIIVLQGALSQTQWKQLLGMKEDKE